MDKGSCVMGGSIVESIVITVGKAIVVSVRKAIVITKRVRVSNHRVVINKGAVGLSMSGNTAVVVSIGISLGISFSIGFCLTTLTANNGGRSRSKSSSRQTSSKSSLQGTTGRCDTIMGSKTNNWGNRSSMVDKRSSMVDQRSSMMKERGSMHLMRNNRWSLNNSFDNRSMGNSVSHWKNKWSWNRGYKRSSERGSKGSNMGRWEMKASIEKELRLSISLTLVKTVDRLIAVARERAGITRCKVWSVGIRVCKR